MKSDRKYVFKYTSPLLEGTEAHGACTVMFLSQCQLGSALGSAVSFAEFHEDYK